MSRATSWITGVGDTPFGRLAGETPLSLMAKAATAALSEAGLPREAVDGLLCGYSGTLPHLMLATLFGEYFGLRPRYAHALQAGGATGGGMSFINGCKVGKIDFSNCTDMALVKV